MAIIKKFSKKFTQIPNEILNNPNLSFKAKGIWAYLWSKPEDWDYSVKGTSSQSKDGRDAVSSGIQELEQNNLLIRKPKFIDGGKFGGADYIIYDVAFSEDEINVSEDNVDGKDVNGKDGIISNTILSNTKESNKEESNGLFQKEIIPTLPETILNYLNEKLKEKNPGRRGFGPVHSNLKHIAALLKNKKANYKLEDFKKVVDSKIKEWHGTAKTEAWLRPSTLFGEKFDVYLTQAELVTTQAGSVSGDGNFVDAPSGHNDLL